MSSPGRLRRLALLAGLAGMVPLVVACHGGSTPESDPADVPPLVKGDPVRVNVCTLVSANQAGLILDQQLSLVGVEWGPSQVPTFRCLFGEEFGVAQMSVQLATGPVAPNVFEDAYGEPAGGDPELLRRLGDGAFMRAEKDERSLHIYVNGSVLSLQVESDPVDPVTRKQMLELGRLAVAAVPKNPVLRTPQVSGPCTRIHDTDVSAAIGAPPSLASGMSGAGGSLICSWTARPGGATVTVFTEPAQVTGYRQTIDRNLYVRVAIPDAPADATVLSRTDRAGDLVAFVGTSAVVQMSVVPSAGFSGADIVTTPGEVQLMSAVLTSLPSLAE